MTQEPEKLHPFLEMTLSSHKTLGKILQHPLVYAVPYFEELNGQYNKQYEARQEKLAKDLKDKNWWGVLAITERPHRVGIFYQLRQRVTDEQYWEILSWLWTDSENIWQNMSKWRQLLRSKRPGRENFMSLEERKFLSGLPEKIRVYRGYQPGKNMNGLSFTLDKEQANFHAKRFRKGGEVLEQVVEKTKVFAYLDSRGEQEIILL